VCASLASKAIACWGNNQNGQLGNGGNTGPVICGGLCNSTPAAPKGLTGTGRLGGIADLESDVTGHDIGYFAITTAGGVDFWGFGDFGRGMFASFPPNDLVRYATPAAE
jgi:hypothetical protein